MNSFMKQMLAAIALLGFATSAQAGSKKFCNHTKEVFTVTLKMTNNKGTKSISFKPGLCATIDYETVNAENISCANENSSTVFTWDPNQINRNFVFYITSTGVSQDNGEQLKKMAAMATATPVPTSPRVEPSYPEMEEASQTPQASTSKKTTLRRK